MNITRSGIQYLYQFNCVHALSVHAFTVRESMLRIGAGPYGVNLLRLGGDMTLDIWVRNVRREYQWSHSNACPWRDL